MTPSKQPGEHRPVVARPHRGRGRPAGSASGASALADREQLIAAAERIIRRDGPDVTMESIAAEAGVTKPMLYRGVGDKDAVVAALAGRFVQRVSSAVVAATAHIDEPKEGLRRFVRAYLQMLVDDHNIYLFVSAGGSNDDRVHQALLMADQSALDLRAALGAMREVQGRDPAVADAWAYSMIGMLHFAGLWWRRDPRLTTAQLTEQLAEMLWGGLHATPW